jgi:glycosyltransferase involved in cell wall biosynthesis
MSRKIVFINQATGYLTIDIINEFAKEFDEVALITGSIRVQDTYLENKVKVSYIIKYNRGNTIKKSLSWLIGTIQIYVLLVVRYRKFEQFYFTIPPTAYLQALYFKSPFSILVYDLYPEALLSFGFSKNSKLYKWWGKRNRKLFTSAYKVFTISEKMRSKIFEYSETRDISVIPNWSAFSGFKRVKKENNKLIAQHNLQGKLIVQYSGNIGVTHKVEVLIEVAELLRSSDEIVFLIIGRGERMNKISNIIQEKGLKNCLILPFRKDEELFDSLCAADLAVITLDDKTPDISVPSKTYNIMAAGVPIMAIAAENSEIANVIDKHQNGKSFDKSNLDGMCRFITEFINDPEYKNCLSKRSLRAAQYYTRSNAKKICDVYLNKF